MTQGYSFPIKLITFFHGFACYQERMIYPKTWATLVLVIALFQLTFSTIQSFDLGFLFHKCLSSAVLSQFSI